MGWTSYHAEFYKNGKIDRKAECDNELTKSGCYEVLKSAMVGATYYGAVRNKDNTVFAVVMLTSVDTKDYFNFAYKDMSETMMPYHFECPQNILNLLTPTNNAWANEWRRRCKENAEIKQAKNGLKNLKVGAKIEVEMPCKTTLHEKGAKVVLTKRTYNGKQCWFFGEYKVAPNLWKEIKEFKIIS